MSLRVKSTVLMLLLAASFMLGVQFSSLKSLFLATEPERPAAPRDAPTSMQPTQDDAGS